MKHTLGSWKVKRHAGGMTAFRVFGPPSCVVPDCEGGGSAYTNEADANLIAAAPDLLEACKKTQQKIWNLISSGELKNTEYVAEINNELEKAISKVEEK